MAVQLGVGSAAFKAPTGPNPQRSSSGGNLATRAAATARPTNSSVVGPSAQASQPSIATTIQQTQGGVVGGTAFDFATDPALQMVMAQQQLAITQAQSTALAQEKAALIAYGDPNLALAITGDKLTAEAAAGNTGSTLATLAANNQQTVRGINENENKANLWYSSDRGYQLGLQQQAYLQNQASAASGVQSSIGGIQNNLLAAEQAAWNAEAQAQEDAYQRALQAPVGVPTSTTTTAGGGGTPVSNLAQRLGTNQYGGPNPPVAPGTPAPRMATSPYTTNVTANRTGGSANLRQGVFAVH